MQASKTARFDTRWTREQKEFFEYASRLSGFRTLSEFVFSSVQERAKKIVKEHLKKHITSNDQRKIKGSEIGESRSL